MKLQDFFDEIYNKLFIDKHINNIFLRLLRVTWRLLANFTLPLYFRITNYKHSRDCQEADIIVSLTSFPARINSVWKTIECIKRQSVRPKKIVLWLSKVQFPQKEEDLPKQLIKEVDDLFKVVFVDDDLRPHKKYYYSFQQFPDDKIITVDDDIFYNSKLIESLYNNSLNQPGIIICNRAHRIIKNKPYNDWGYQEIHNVQGMDVMPTGIGGVLYPPRCYDNTIFDVKAIKETCLNADDLWLNFNSRLKGTEVYVTNYQSNFLPINSTINSSLTKSNLGGAQNDKQISLISIWAKRALGVDFYNNIV